MQIRQLTPFTGAEITGIDIGAGIEEGTFIAVRDAIHRHAMVVIRDQRLSPSQQVFFMRRLGVIREEPYNRYAVPGAPELMILSNIRENGKQIGSMDAGGIWHTDKLHTPTPNMYTILYALQVPMKDGVPLGDTLFTNVAEAYDWLPDATKEKLLPLMAVHDHDVSLARKSERGVLNRTLDRNDHRVTKHPIIASHPITGRKCLLATEGHTARICDLPSAESDALLAELWAHVRRPEFVYRHSWRVQDLVIWDNRSSQHQAIFDYGDLPRRIHRGETTGPAPVPAASASLEACRTAARPA